MARRRKQDEQPINPGIMCEMPGCMEAGQYKAPKSRDNLQEYRWLCLDHIREHNAKWDYFTGMSSEQIEDFMKDAMLGHRPTWKTNQQRLDAKENLDEALHRFWHGNAGPSFKEKKRKEKQAAQQSEQERKALAVLDMEGEVTLADIKRQYKILVKKYHPDVNAGKPEIEERFKRITEAYQSLLKLKSKS